MKQKEGFKLRHIGSEHIIVAEGLEHIDFSQIISLNESACLLWEAVEGKEFDATTLAGLLVSTYEIDPETAQKDAADLLQNWLQAGIISE